MKIYSTETYETMNTRRWLLLEEYELTYIHIKGTNNIVADELSRMEFKNKPGLLCAHAIGASYRNEAINVPDPNNWIEMANTFGLSKRKRVNIVSYATKVDSPRATE